MTVGLTGGIGSGKTTVARLMETMGCVLYDSDSRAKELYDHPVIREQVTGLLGNPAYHDNGTLNRAHVSAKVFSDPELLKQLNAIVHPALKTDFEAFAARFAKQIVVKESAILFETGIYRDLQLNILVTAPIEQKIQRVMLRNALSRQEVEKRMEAQWSDEQKKPLADYLIGNADNEALTPQVLHVVNELRKQC